MQLTPYTAPSQSSIIPIIQDITPSLQSGEVIQFAFGCSIRKAGWLSALTHVKAWRPGLFIWTNYRIIFSELDGNNREVIKIDHQSNRTISYIPIPGRADIFDMQVTTPYDVLSLCVAIGQNEYQCPPNFANIVKQLSRQEPKPKLTPFIMAVGRLFNWGRAYYSSSEFQYIVELRFRNFIIFTGINALLAFAKLMKPSPQLIIFGAISAAMYPNTAIGILFPKHALGIEKSHMIRTKFQYTTGYTLHAIGLALAVAFVAWETSR